MCKWLRTNNVANCSNAFPVPKKDRVVTQVCAEMSFFKVRVVSYVFWYADFRKNTQKILARAVFTQMENLCMERVKPGCFID